MRQPRHSQYLTLHQTFAYQCATECQALLTFQSYQDCSHDGPEEPRPEVRGGSQTVPCHHSLDCLVDVTDDEQKLQQVSRSFNSRRHVKASPLLKEHCRPKKSRCLHSQWLVSGNAVAWAFPSLWRLPGDVLTWNFDVACFTVNTTGKTMSATDATGLF